MKAVSHRAHHRGWHYTYVMSWYGPGTHPRTKEAKFASWIQKLAVSCRPNSGSKPDGDRCQKFASLNQPFNFNAGGFGQPFAAVLTASQKTYASVRAAINAYLEREKLPTSYLPLHILPNPTDIDNLGTDKDEREMKTMLMRRYPRNTTVMKMYYDETPVQVLRVTPEERNASSGYFTRENSTFLPRTTGKSEAGLATGVTHDQLLSDLDALGEAIEAEQKKLRKIQHSDSYSFMKPFFKTGLDCIDDGTECNGDCADTLYPISGNIYKARQCRMVPIIKDHCHQATIDSSTYDHFVVYGSITRPQVSLNMLASLPITTIRSVVSSQKAARMVTLVVQTVFFLVVLRTDRLPTCLPIFLLGTVHRLPVQSHFVLRSLLLVT